jgi:sec-independent protein translocase protein TatB
MLDFGFSEILLTSAIALVVLGPERLPKVARQVGNWMGRARAMARQLSEQLEREVSAEELLRERNQTRPVESRSGEERIAPPLPAGPVAVTPAAPVASASPPPAAAETGAAPPTFAHPLDLHSAPGLDASRSPND